MMMTTQREGLDEGHMRGVRCVESMILTMMMSEL